MTTLAYRSGVLASDSGVYRGASFAHRMKKVHRLADGALIALGGDVNQMEAFLDWIKSGQKGRKPKSNEVSAIYVSPTGQLWHYDGGRRGHKIKEPYYAAGSGAEVALGAMFSGADARSAIKAAIRHDVYSKGPVQAEELA